MSAPPGVPQHRKRPIRDPDLGWQEQARCLTEDPELFYPDNSNVGVAKAAKRVCAMCPVREQCLHHALAHNEIHGIWGWLHRWGTPQTTPPPTRKGGIVTTEWRDIPGYFGYQVSRDGRVRSIDRTITDSLGRKRRLRGKILSPFLDAKGYFRVAPGRRPLLLHRLVCMAFHGTPGDGLHAAHRDGDSRNNRSENLYWATPSQNQQDRVRHGRHHNVNKTHCPRGHEYTPENTFNHPKHRRCRACHRDANVAYQERVGIDGVRAMKLRSYHRRKATA